MESERSNLNSTFADIQYLTGSPNRTEFLKVLAESPTSREALRETLSVSRITIGRMIKSLEERGWIGRSQDSIHITPLGEAVIAAYQDFYSVIETAQSLQPINAIIQLEDLPFDPLEVEDREIILTNKHDPFRTVRTLTDLKSSADSVQMVSPVYYDELVRSAGDTTNGDATNSVQIIFPEEVFEDLSKDSGRTKSLRELVHHDSSTLLVCDDDLPPYLFGLVDQSVVFQIFDDLGIPVALIQISDEPVREWVSTELGRIQANSQEVGTV